MVKTILAINAGSSSVKVALFRETRKRAIRLASAEVAGLNEAQPSFEYQRGDHQDKTTVNEKLGSHDAAFKYILRKIYEDQELKDVGGQEDITYACHRVVHGADYSEEVLITKETVHHIEDLEDLAPLYVASCFHGTLLMIAT